MSENAQQPDITQDHGPSPEHKRLDIFVGQWIAEGETRDGRIVPIRANDSYEWLPGEYFLVHKTEARIGEDVYQSTEIMGYDAAQKIYTMRFFDNWGQTGTYQATVHFNTWTITGEHGRATLVISDDGQTMTGDWEMSPNGTDWQPWMVMTLTKAK